jgi:ABC-type siderophore export system fused ATPase/permease subunit
MIWLYKVAHDNWKKIKLFEDVGMIDWLVYNANFSSISAMWWSKQILYTKTKIRKTLFIYIPGTTS